MSEGDKTQETAAIETITPAVAERMLASSPGNPRWSNDKLTHTRHVAALARDMEAGNFHVAEAIQFDRNGELINGHHRLAAILLSGATQRMVVVRGVSQDAIPIIDADRMARSLDQSASALGKYWITKNVAKTTRRMIAGDMAAPDRLTRQEQIAFAEDHKEALIFTDSLFPTNRRHVSVASVQAAVARGWYHVHKETLRAVARVLYSGIPETPSEASVIRLRDFLMTTDSGSGVSQAEIYGKASRAILAVEQGQVLRALYAPSTDLFPLPGSDDTSP